MARGINKVILIGNLGADPDSRSTQAGMTVTVLSLATTSVRKDRDGQTQERTEWHRVKLFGRLGEIANSYLRKGQQVYIEGSIRYDKFKGKDGQDRYSTDIIADEMQMLGGVNAAIRSDLRQPSNSAHATGERSTPFTASENIPWDDDPPF